MATNGRHDSIMASATRMVMLRAAVERAGSDAAIAMSVTEVKNHPDGSIDVLVATGEHRTQEEVAAVADAAAAAMDRVATVPVAKGRGWPAGAAWAWTTTVGEEA